MSNDVEFDIANGKSLIIPW